MDKLTTDNAAHFHVVRDHCNWMKTAISNIMNHFNTLWESSYTAAGLIS